MNRVKYFGILTIGILLVITIGLLIRSWPNIRSFRNFIPLLLIIVPILIMWFVLQRPSQVEVIKPKGVSNEITPKNKQRIEIIDTTSSFNDVVAARDYLVSLSYDPKAFLEAGANPNSEFHEAFRVLMESLNEEERAQLQQIAKQGNEAFRD